jgi:hypothetical protein
MGSREVQVLRRSSHFVSLPTFYPFLRNSSFVVSSPSEVLNTVSGEGLRVSASDFDVDQISFRQIIMRSVFENQTTFYLFVIVSDQLVFSSKSSIIDRL